MPETIEIQVYAFDELESEAKDRARAWFREGALDDDWHASVYEDFGRICDLLGVELTTSSVRLMGGGRKQKPNIWFSGFWSQGDGACFEGTYSYRKGAAQAIRTYAPMDTELHRIADALQAVQRRHFYRLFASAVHRGRYYHAYAMSIDVRRNGSLSHDVAPDAEEAISEGLRDLARWLYRQLEADYEAMTSEPAIDDRIRANGYTFTEDGQVYR